MLVFSGEEDFGIIPVEAMASGCPVVAYGRGGAVETVGAWATAEALDRVARGGAAVVPGGVLFGEQTAESVARAIELAEATVFDPEALHAATLPFANAEFDRHFMESFARTHDAWRARDARPVPDHVDPGVAAS
jgi:glycosyltransferase involved in cell wall biosynthesis